MQFIKQMFEKIVANLNLKWYAFLVVLTTMKAVPI